MAKKDKNIYNIQNMNCEIDYEKLAKAIVKAQKEAEKQEDEPNKQTMKFNFMDFIKRIIAISRGKADTKGQLTKGMFASLNCVAFNTLSKISFIISFLALMAVFFVGFHMQWSWTLGFINVVKLFLIVLASIALFMISILLKGASNEMENEQDKNFLVAVFSGLMSTMALVVALVALFKR